MANTVNDKTLASQLNRHLSKHQNKKADALEKLSTGSVFTKGDPRPSERYIAERMQNRVRSLTTAKRNINDAVSLLQTAESSMSEINNMVNRMKEINLAAATTTVSDQERRFLFIEYEALHNELNRVSLTTEFNGIPLLNGDSDKVPEQLIFRLDDPKKVENSSFDGDDINILKFDGLKQINTTTEALGLVSAQELIDDSNEEEGIELDDVQEMLIPEDEDLFQTVYDQAITRLSQHRASFGALQVRMDKAMDFIDVYQENISAAHAKISDIDYAQEVSKLVESKINLSATTALLAQTNMGNNMSLQLLSNM